MSKIALSGNASGTGVFTFASPNSNTDRTLTLPDNTGTVLTSASSIAASQLPAGSVLQVVYGSTSSEVIISTGAFTDIGLSASITPSSSSSKIMVICSVQARVFISTGDNAASIRLLRNGSSIFAPTNSYQFGYNNRAAFNMASEESYQIPLIYLDSPASTSALTYKIQGQSRSSASGNAAHFQDDGFYTSNIILMEIAG